MARPNNQGLSQMEVWTPEAIRNDLQEASLVCAKHHLLVSSHWASTALLSYREPEGVAKDPKSSSVQDSSGPSRWQSPSVKPIASTPVSVFKVPFPPSSQVSTPLANFVKEPVSDTQVNPTHDTTVFSVGFAVAQQNHKEAWTLAEGKMDTIPLLRFLYYYAKYLHIEKIRSLHQSEEGMNLVDKAYFSRLHDQLCRDIADYLRRSRQREGDGALLYLYGKLLRKQKKIDEAIQAFVDSILLEPKFIESWMELAECMENRAEIMKVSANLPHHWIRSYFLGKAYGHIGLTERAFSAFETFQNLGFAGNPDLNNSLGKLLMTIDPTNSLSFMDAARLFAPTRMNDVDSYSHLLFIVDDHVRMRILADDILYAGRFTAECSIALGNFYGLLGDHDKSVANFSRALRYNPDLHHVWTLIGHEQVELKQTEFAMKSYTNAIEADPKEYRAWYGLGQTMEILRAHASALYYFKGAFESCPSDTRMLLALGDTFQILDNYTDAEMSYWRAYQVDADTIVLVRLARMFEKLGRYGRAAELYVKYTADVQAESNENLGSSLADRDDAEDLGHAYLYLAKYYLLHRLFENAFEEAQAAEIFREVKEEAHAMQKQISRIQAEARDTPEESPDVEPTRLGFPLWKETVVIDATPITF